MAIRIERPGLLAPAYLLRGWSIFPLPRGRKIPDRPWKRWQSARPSLFVVEQWFRQAPDANVAVVTGAISGLVVADIDLVKHPDAAREFSQRSGGELPAAPTVRTGGGGLHLFFAHPGFPVRSRAGLFPGLDVRADGAFVVAPPSLHPSGSVYRWEADTVFLPPPPSWLISEVNATPARASMPGTGATAGGNGGALKIYEGRRNSELFRVGCAIRGQGWDRAWIEAELMVINQVRCIPPLPDSEVAQIAASAARYPAG